MSIAGREKQLLFTTAVILGALLGHSSSGRSGSGRGSNLSIGPRYSQTLLLPVPMWWGRVGSQTKENVQGWRNQDSSVAFVNDVEGRSQYKDKSEESEKSQTPPVHKDIKLMRKNSFLHSAWVIIAIALTIVLGAIAVYYWILFYPIMCKKERKYDVMQMSAKP
ncbi:uncharacterized protein LOC114123861 isoform X4 [Aphis gossypii]|uniref:uncharacterized protein LOC114123861 isoform X1 n=1 Tax=Aphis gossypii TaxID=80765 RepID=UPI002158FDA3|nr:uncharacterized protein LOC114123861 isoform X1 [Aphis gossypii]XP_050059446.1 uncharacterized protein LOC114123861 isoform X3 [Aphis gossypii]XP_050059451.1 uncharacterized protein LOC114123861 isoform X4 [Aphis gossypii]